MSRESILTEITDERGRQHDKGFDVTSDLLRNPLDWHEMIADYNAWARRMACMGDWDKARRRWMQTAALAVAAVEALDLRIAGATDSAVPHE